MERTITIRDMSAMNKEMGISNADYIKIHK